VLRPLGQLRLAVYGALLIALFLGVRRGVVPTLCSLFDLGRRPSTDESSSGRGSAASGQGAEASKH
jgi:hypothetical protein